MSSPRSAPVLDLSPGPSASLAVVTTAIYGAAAAAPFASAIPLAAAIAIAAVLTGVWAWLVNVRCLRRNPSAVVRLVVEDLECVIVDRRGRSRSGTLLGSTRFGNWLIVLRIRIGHRVRTEVVARDSMTAEAFRRFAFHLRFTRAPPAGGLARRLLRRLRKDGRGMA